MASIRDVAKEAGVAICTVSRLINGTAKVEPETQKKIEDAMKKLDYVPNELARGMFKGRSNSIAMLVPNIHHWHRRLKRYFMRKSINSCFFPHRTTSRRRRNVLSC